MPIPIRPAKCEVNWDHPLARRLVSVMTFDCGKMVTQVRPDQVVKDRIGRMNGIVQEGNVVKE